MLPIKQKLLDWFRTILLLGFLGITQAGCDPTTLIGSIVGTTIFTGLSPSNELHQVYYLGVFDPHEQIPPTVYRVRVRGQASAISLMKFGSGWVPADLIDSLGTTVKANDGGGFSVTKTDQGEFPSLPTGRKLMMFGPEGFREAPKNHRLVIIMGSDPSAYFEAIDTALGQVSQAQAEQRTNVLTREMFEALTMVKNERENLDELERDIAVDLPQEKEAN